MGRPFYPNEADDADLDWLISNFLYERPNYYPVETDALPLVLIPFKEDTFDLSEEAEVEKDLFSK